MRIDFAVIGGQKCGSTLLQSMLADHPDIFMPEGESAQLEDAEFRSGGFERLEKELLPAPSNKVIGIKRPSYLSMPQVAERLYEINPNIKVIAVVRNPYDRLRSAYFHLINYGLIPAVPLNEGLRLVLRGDWRESYPRSEELIDFGRYATHLAPYQKQFGEQLRVFFQDDLVRDKLEVVRGVYQWLGVKPDYMPRRKYLENRAQGVNYSLMRARWLRLRLPLVLQFDRERHTMQRKTGIRFRKLLDKAIIYTDFFLLKHIFGNNKPSFDPDVLDALAEVYEPELLRLEEMLGADLSSWKAKSRG